MAFEFGISGFTEFITRPFTNPIGWVLIIVAVVWIWLRLTGRIGGKPTEGQSGGGGADYIIK